jgi:hypothetical protein
MLYFSFKRLVPGGFNLDSIASTCTILPRSVALPCRYTTTARARQLLPPAPPAPPPPPPLV